MAAVILAVVLVFSGTGIAGFAEGDESISLGNSELSLGISSFGITTYSGGAGSSGKFLAPIDPPAAGAIPISNRAELEAIKDNLSGSYYLTQDIDLSGAEWIPIGNASGEFTGTFDGQGHIISNLKITGDVQYAGLFGIVSLGIIKNVGLENTEITISTSSSYYYAGSICGRGYSANLNNCYNDGGNITTSSLYAGGICGYFTTASLEETFTISNCYNTGDISSFQHAGGICGIIELGSFASLSVSECYNTGRITAFRNAGGICGGANGVRVTISKCFNMGDVSSSGSTRAYAGGICSTTSGKISDCYNTGAISASVANTAPFDPYAGGICGTSSYNNTDAIKNCYNIGSVLSYNPYGGAHAGGIAGSIASNATAATSYSLNLYGSSYGTQLTDTQMRSESSFVGFDFDNVWMMPADGGYPILQGQNKAEADDGNLRILSFDWVEPASMMSQGIDAQSNIPIYVFDTYVYAQKIYLTVTDGADWELYKNPACTEILDKTSTQYYAQLDLPYILYIKLTKSGVNDAIYGLEITRRVLPMVDTDTNIYSIRYPTENGEATVPVKMGAEFFSATNLPTTYRKELALVAAALTACSKKNAEYLIDSGGAFDELEFTEKEHYSSGGAHSFSIASRKMIIDGKEQLVVAVVLRGTETFWEALFDWQNGGVVNLDNSDYMVYKYYNEYAEKVWDRFNDYVSQDWVKQKYGTSGTNIKVLIGGHSLGGAAANLFAAKFKLSNHSIPTSSVYAYTFGALNTLEWPYDFVIPNNQATENQRKATGVEFSYIQNIFNSQDTFGPSGKGDDKTGITPAYGDLTSAYKFGKTKHFDLNYSGNDYYKNHDMPCYVSAVHRGLVGENTNLTRISCPVDVDVFDSANTLVARTRNNVVDESVTIIPIYIEGDNKYMLLSSNSKYTLEISAFDDGNMEYYIENSSSDNNSYMQYKMFSNVTLISGKKMYSEVGGSIHTQDTKLYVINDSGVKIAEIQMDGTEIPISNNSNANPQRPTPPTNDNSGGSNSFGESHSENNFLSAPIIPKEQWIDANAASKYVQDANNKKEEFVRTKYNGLQGVRAAAWSKLSSKRYMHDTVDGNKVQVRIYVDNPSGFNDDTLVSGYLKGVMVDTAQKLFEKWFKNQIRVVHLDQQGNWNQPVHIAAKVDLTGMDTQSLYFYSYDKKANSYKRIANPNYWIDTNGFLHFTTLYAGDIIISERALAKR